MTFKHTAFYKKHIALSAKIIPFAGYEMPVQYAGGIISEHKRVRNTVGVFDVSHMGEIIVSGEEALDYLNLLTINDVSKLIDGQAHYTAMCYEDGGIVDDLLIYKFPEYYLCVVNASNIKKDFDWMTKHLKGAVKIKNVSDEYSQLAVQGKFAEATLQKLTEIKLADIEYYHFIEGSLANNDMIISRTGYTGEAGFELYFLKENSSQIWDAIFTAGKEFDIEAIGLGARDSLRLEKRMALYGNDIDHTTNPIEAGLGWITKFDKGEFVAYDILKRVKEKKPDRRLVALRFEDKKAFPRHGYSIVDDSGNKIGNITSGTISPMLELGIAMGYVPSSLAAIGTKHNVQIRKRVSVATIIKGTFV